MSENSTGQKGAESLYQDAQQLVGGTHYAQALTTLLAALNANPQHLASLRLAAMLSTDLSQLADAFGLAQRWLQLQPDNAEVNGLLGHLYMRSARDAQAKPHLALALSSEPSNFRWLRDQAYVLHRLADYEAAIASYQAALKQAPKELPLRFSLAMCLEAAKRMREAAEEYAILHKASPKSASYLSRLIYARGQICEWQGEEKLLRQLQKLMESAETLAADDLPEPWLTTFLPISEKACAKWVARSVQQLPHKPKALWPKVQNYSKRRIRLGYLSPDFGQHAIGALMQDVFAAHDRSFVEVFAYSLRNHQDAVAEKIKQGVDHFVDLSLLSDPEAAARIGRDQLDVLIDMGGFTAGARPAILALRPAATIWGYLGYLGDYAGLVDALIVDKYTQALADTVGGRQPLLQLQTCLLPGFIHPPMNEASTRAEFGLPEKRFLFCSFNQPHKLDAQLLESWVEIHKKVPNSSFVVYLPHGSEQGFLAHWQKLGGDKSSVIPAKSLNYAAFVRRLSVCDLFLDAFRHQGGATSVAALAASIPILSLAGPRWAQQMSTSCSYFLNRPEWVANSAQDYVFKAVAIANSALAIGAEPTKSLPINEFDHFFFASRVALEIESLLRSMANK